MCPCVLILIHIVSMPTVHTVWNNMCSSPGGGGDRDRDRDRAAWLECVQCTQSVARYDCSLGRQKMKRLGD